MFITFQLKSAPQVLMREEHAKRLLDLLGKDIHQGIITSEEASSAIAKINTEIGATKEIHDLHDLGSSSHDEEQDGHDLHHPPTDTVSLHARAFPLLQLLHSAQENKTDIVWGV